jgi:hypothetical protein
VHRSRRLIEKSRLSWKSDKVLARK